MRKSCRYDDYGCCVLPQGFAAVGGLKNISRDVEVSIVRHIFFYGTAPTGSTLCRASSIFPSALSALSF